MKTKEAIDTLREYNRWRRGADIPQPDPTKIGKAIDFAIREMINFQRVKVKNEKRAHNRGDAGGEAEEAQKLSNKADKYRPEFHTEAFFTQMKRRLYTKAPEKYMQWAELGKSEDNWYFVDGEWRIYRGGKRIYAKKVGE